MKAYHQHSGKVGCVAADGPVHASDVEEATQLAHAAVVEEDAARVGGVGGSEIERKPPGPALGSWSTLPIYFRRTSHLNFSLGSSPLGAHGVAGKRREAFDPATAIKDPAEEHVCGHVVVEKGRVRV